VEGAPKSLAKALAKVLERVVGDGREGATAKLERVSRRGRVIFPKKHYGNSDYSG
jgi:hypothetical protein